MHQYLSLMSDVLMHGVQKKDRTGVGTLSLFGEQLKFNLRRGFPLVTTKKVHFKSVVHELLWMLSGSTNVKDLQKNGVTIWDEWADEHGELGPVYGHQWRSWECSDGRTIDQISAAQDMLRNNPDSRRIIVSAWNVEHIELMKLPPCHMQFQFFSMPNIPSEPGCSGGGECKEPGCCVPGPRVLHCMMTQRSADLFLGVPFNIASYALLTCMMAQSTGHVPGVLTINFGDVHIYNNHYSQVKEQLGRDPQKSPILQLNPEVKNILDFKFEDIVLEGYEPLPAIKASVAV